MARILPIVAFLVISGCSVFVYQDYNRKYGEPQPERLDTPPVSQTIDYWADVKPVLDQRCVVCHACYDAPCQLKLSSYEGLARGANPKKVYNGQRLLATDPTRLFMDAQTTEQWREKGFHAVVNERDNTELANVESSVMAQLLLQKQEFPLPETQHLDKSFDISLSREQQCTKIETFAEYKEKYPLWGMPYALPGLAKQEHETLMSWLRKGTPREDQPSTLAKHSDEIAEWEAFLNRDSLKAQLMARYLFEHLFLAHLYFDAESPVFYRLVRSSTPPGSPVEGIYTRRPFLDPEVDRVYYRFASVPSTIVDKTHMPYKLSGERMQKWQRWFLDANYTVKSLPDYTPEHASNPFITFKDIPTSSRYRFLLDEAQYTIMNFIKGPVCRGQTALNVIQDYFWVVFVDPEVDMATNDETFMYQAFEELEMPAEAGANAFPAQWLHYAKQERAYRAAKVKYLNQHAVGKVPIDLDLVWHGDGENQNATLTIFRHFDSASVLKGLQGDAPQSAWLISYPILERIHYLLVAGYDVYGNVGHQLNTRIYMDFLRMESESNVLAFLPKEARKKAWQHWYRGAVSPVLEYINEHQYEFRGETALQYESDNVLSEFYGKLKQDMAKVLDVQHSLDKAPVGGSIKKALGRIDGLTGKAAASLPQTVFLAVENDKTGKKAYFTLLHHMQYTNISHLFGNEDRRLPNEDSLTVLNGLVGAYPNAFLHVKESEVADLVGALESMTGKSDMQAVMDDYGVRRTNQAFWQFSDEIHDAYRDSDKVRYGLFDYNRLEDI